MLRLLKDVAIDGDAVRCFVCVKNAADRIPFFLDYYRRLGVGGFYFVDNNSSDGSAELLAAQPDVAVFWTDESYQEANAGRKWTDELMTRYAGGAWCLTLDIDEFLLFPYCEQTGLRFLCDYLDRQEAEGLFCVMLDHYPGGDLAEAVYRSGDSVFDVAPCHDAVHNYLAHAETYFPFLNVRGGVRQRVFSFSTSRMAGPPQKKIPLVRHHEGFSYHYSTHGVTPMRLADVTGVLAHFKFFADSEAYVANEISGRDRKNPDDYRRYLKGLRKNPSLYSAGDSVLYRDSAALVEHGFMAVSVAYLVALRALLEHAPGDFPGGMAAAVQSQIRDRAKNAVELAELIRVWPLLCALQPQRHEERCDEFVSLYHDAENYVKHVGHHYSLAVSLPLRRFLRRKRLINAKALPEFMGDDYTLKERIRFTYDSVWWDLAAPVRLVWRLVSYLKLRFRH